MYPKNMDVIGATRTSLLGSMYEIDSRWLSSFFYFLLILGWKELMEA